ncbi:MAG: 4Fe-4S dicluster domain-containing protein [Planctomycetota bacterium]
MSHSPPSYGFVIDNRRCIGCHACTVACKSEHSDPIGINKTWVSYIEKGTFPDVSREFHVMRCNHCADAPCVEICPTACLVTRSDGIVDFDPGRCIGCKACMQACPYDAIAIHPDTGTATKCNYCSHRVDGGREPACVVVCPAEAIIAGDLNDPGSRIARLVTNEDVTVRKPEKGTRPKLYYVDGDASALNPSGAALRSETLWGSKAPDLATASQAAVAPDATERGRPRRAYDIAQRHAGSWGWKVSAYLFTKSIAAGVFVVPALAFLASPAPSAWVFDAFRVSVPIALLALAITGALLVADLKRPERFLWVLLRPQWRSWLVRGAYIITAYGLFLPLWWWLGPTRASGAASFFAGLGLLLAGGTAAYTGWLFGQAKGRDLWQSPLVPAHLLVQAGAAGAATLLIASGGSVGSLAKTLQVLLLLNLGLIAQDVWGKHATADASRAARLLRTGDRGVWFYAGVIAAGHVLPMVALLVGTGVGGVLAALLALVGLAVYEHLWVEAPQRLPLA